MNEATQQEAELIRTTYLGEPAYLKHVKGVRVIVAQSAFSMLKDASDDEIKTKINAMAQVNTFNLATMKKQGRGLAIGFSKAKQGMITQAPHVG